MIVGFTGTRAGLTDRQCRALKELLRKLRPSEFHHGDCVGADLEAHLIALSLGIPVVLHPATTAGQRAWCQGARETFKPKPPLTRNADIVESCQVLVACPRTMSEELRSGTWATVRYACRDRTLKAQTTDVAIVWPEDGEGKFSVPSSADPAAIIADIQRTLERKTR